MRNLHVRKIGLLAGMITNAVAILVKEAPVARHPENHVTMIACFVPDSHARTIYVLEQNIIRRDYVTSAYRHFYIELNNHNSLC